MNGYTEEIGEEERLQNILTSCDEQIKREPDNLWWVNYRQQAQERLEEIYTAEHCDDIADARACEKFNTSL